MRLRRRALTCTSFIDKLKDNRRVIVHLSENESKKSYPQTAEETLQKHHFHVVDTLAKRKQSERVDVTIGSEEYREQVLKPIVGDKAIKRGSARLLVNPYTFNFLGNIFRLTYVRDGKTVRAAALQERLVYTQSKNITNINKERVHTAVGGVSVLLLSGRAHGVLTAYSVMG